MLPELTLPEQSKPLYDKTSHKQFCELCEKNNIPVNKRLEYAEELGVGFGYFYMSRLEENLDGDQYFLNKSDGEVNKYDKALNTTADIVGDVVGHAMTPYLIRRDGVVDSWPSPEYENAFSVPLWSKHFSRYYDDVEEDYQVENEKEISGYMTAPFNYFGGKYVQHVERTTNKDESKYHKSSTTTSVWSIEQEPGLFFKERHYQPDGSKVYNDLFEEVLSYKRQYEDASRRKAEQKSGTLGNLFVYSPLIITLLIALLALFWTFTGTESLEAAVNHGFLFRWITESSRKGGLLQVLTIVPAMFLKIAAICWYLPALFGPVIVIICMIMLIIGGFYLSVMIEEHFSTGRTDLISSEEWKEALNAKKKAEQLENSPTYKELEKEFFELVDEYEEFSHNWHKAWFDACKSTNKW